MKILNVALYFKTVFLFVIIIMDVASYLVHKYCFFALE